MATMTDDAESTKWEKLPDKPPMPWGAFEPGNEMLRAIIDRQDTTNLLLARILIALGETP